MVQELALDDLGQMANKSDCCRTGGKSIFVRYPGQEDTFAKKTAAVTYEMYMDDASGAAGSDLKTVSAYKTGNNGHYRLFGTRFIREEHSVQEYENLLSHHCEKAEP